MKKATRVLPHSFGGYVSFDGLIADDQDVIVLCVCTGSGLRPVEVLLPHQCYLSTVAELQAQFVDSEVWAIPARSSDYVLIAPGEDQ